MTVSCIDTKVSVLQPTLHDFIFLQSVFLQYFNFFLLSSVNFIILNHSVGAKTMFSLQSIQRPRTLAFLKQEFIGTFPFLLVSWEDSYYGLEKNVEKKTL